MGSTPTDPRTFLPLRRRHNEVTAAGIRAESHRKLLRRRTSEVTQGISGELDQPVAPEGGSARAAARLVALCVATLLFAALLNAAALLDGAEQKPYGAEREFWVATWTPLARVSGALYLDRPRSWIDQALGRGPSPVVRPRAWLSGVASYPGETPRPLQAAEPVPLLRTPSAAEPLRLWIGGDSMSAAFGPALARMASESSLITAAYDAELSSGLTRPDFFDWPLHLAEVASARQPEIFVIFLGANDAQAIRTTDGAIYQPETPGWISEYRARVRQAMTTLDAPGRIVVWVGLPIMETEGFSRRMAVQNEIYREEADGRERARYIDAWALFADGSGNYAAFLPDGDGALQGVRMQDGVHLSREGADRLARAVFQAIQGDVPALAEPQ
ncbi:MAG: DUF459 domain-containing protein [Dehalococcoidia bacterium]